MEQVVIGQFWLGSRAFQSYKPNYAKTRFDKLLLPIPAQCKFLPEKYFLYFSTYTLFSYITKDFRNN